MISEQLFFTLLDPDPLQLKMLDPEPHKMSWFTINFAINNVENGRLSFSLSPVMVPYGTLPRLVPFLHI